MDRSRMGVMETACIAVIGGIVVAGPMLASGAILNLDFVLLPHAPVPDGVWALGPELPRRVPVMLPLAWLDPIIGSLAAGKAMFVAALAAAFVGATRLVPADVDRPWVYAAGALYAFGSFATTRLAVGHLFVLVAMAVLPFALPHLLRPAHDLRRTFLWSVAMALTGSFGGLLAVVLVAVGAVGHGRRGLGAFAAAVAAQVPWAVPGVLVGRGTYELAPAAAFRPEADGILGLLALPAGSGFWQDTFQVGWRSPPFAALLGVSVLGLAWSGRSHLPQLPRLGAVAAAALALVVAASLESLDPLAGRLLQLPGLVGFRETQRLLVLFLVWAAPASAVGAQRLARRTGPGSAPLLRASALVVALLAAAPGAWGAGGQLHAVDLPTEWHRARELVRAEPGTVLALPWFQYLDLDVADGRRVLNPLPLWFGGDVLRASDPRIPGAPAREQDDPRAPVAARLLAANVGGEPVASELAELGVRWVAVADGGGVLRGRSIGALHVEALTEDDGLRHVLDGESLNLFEVTGWRGPVLTADGVTLEPRFLVGPFATLPASGPATYFRSGQVGWLRGTERVDVDDLGRLQLPAGEGLLWYWPGAVTTLSYVALIMAVVPLWVQTRRVRYESQVAKDDTRQPC